MLKIDESFRIGRKFTRWLLIRNSVMKNKIVVNNFHFFHSPSLSRKFNELLARYTFLWMENLQFSEENIGIKKLTISIHVYLDTVQLPG